MLPFSKVSKDPFQSGPNHLSLCVMKDSLLQDGVWFGEPALLNSSHNKANQVADALLDRSTVRSMSQKSVPMETFYQLSRSFSKHLQVKAFRYQFLSSLDQILKLITPNPLIVVNIQKNKSRRTKQVKSWLESRSQFRSTLNTKSMCQSSIMNKCMLKKVTSRFWDK